MKNMSPDISAIIVPSPALLKTVREFVSTRVPVKVKVPVQWETINDTQSPRLQETLSLLQNYGRQLHLLLDNDRTQEKVALRQHITQFCQSCTRVLFTDNTGEEAQLVGKPTEKDLEILKSMPQLLANLETIIQSSIFHYKPVLNERLKEPLLHILPDLAEAYNDTIGKALGVRATVRNGHNIGQGI